MSTQTASYWNNRISKIQSATHKKVFSNALRRNGNNYKPLISFSTPISNSNPPLKRLNALIPHNITSLRKKRIGQSSKEPGEPSHLNRLIYSFGGRRTKKRTRRHRRHRKHHK